ncbi:MAG: 4Fe-4S dicluster domain-containing protein [Nitrospinota bacterium]
MENDDEIREAAENARKDQMKGNDGPGASTPPESPISIRQEACISVRSSFEGCRLCMEACPDDCLGFKSSGEIALNADKCSSCGVCVAACPSSVFTLKRHEDSVVYDAAFFAIEKSPELTFGCRYSDFSPASSKADEAEAIILPCLSMLNETMITDAVLEGAESVSLEAPCGGCRITHGMELIERSVSRAAGLLAALDNQAAVSFKVTESEPGKEETAPIGERFSRRSFLTDVGKTLVREALRDGEMHEEPKIASGYLPAIPLTHKRRSLNVIAKPFKTPGPEFTEKSSPFRVLRINDNCTACMACSTYCPTGALSRRETPESADIFFQARTCLKCWGCADLCPEGSISYDEKFTVQTAMAGPRIAFQKKMKVCLSCDRPFMPKSNEERCKSCVKFGKFQKGLFNSIRRDT